MSTGQTLLTMGAIVLFSYTAININRTYISSVKDQVQVQSENEIINYGQSLAELMYSYSTATSFPALKTVYGNCEEIENTCPVLKRETKLGFSLYATISLEESAIADTLAVITIYERPDTDEDFEQSARFQAAITRIPTN